MKLLLDTCTFLWFVSKDASLREDQREAICDPENLVFLSSVSAAEIGIKVRIQKLTLPEDPGTYVPRLRIAHHFIELPLGEEPSLRLATLPLLHRDPFDRLLICQSHIHDMTLVTSDPLILQYQVRTL